MHKTLIKTYEKWTPGVGRQVNQRRGPVFGSKNFQFGLVKLCGCQPQVTHKKPKNTKNAKKQEKHKNARKHRTNTKITKTQQEQGSQK